MRKWMIAPVVLMILAFVWAVYTDIIILRTTEDMAGSESAAAILFVGNSHVFVGDVPKQLQTIAAAHGVEVAYKDLSRHGASLSRSKDNAIREMGNKRYDYVVLQDQSRRQQSDIAGFMHDIRILCDAARESGAIPVLYNPAWASINGQPDIAHQNVLTQAYKQAADDNDTMLVNAGDAWVYAYQQIPGIALYTKFDPRGPHANNAGAFFTACVFAATLFDLHVGEIPTNSLYKGSDALGLAQAAWEFTHE